MRLAEQSTTQRGFTLLELTIVMAVLAIGAIAAVLVLNPAEQLRRARDTRRIADLQSISSALLLYLQETPNAQLASGVGGGEYPDCLGDVTGANITARIWYSADSTSFPITDSSRPASVGGDASGANWPAPPAEFDRQVATKAEIGETDGTGWLPVNIGATPSGSPLEKFPADPTNQINNGTSVSSADLVYRYACDMSKPLQFEINAILEANASTTKEQSDGGDNPTYYEVGRSLRLLPTTTDF